MPLKSQKNQKKIFQYDVNANEKKLGQSWCIKNFETILNFR